VFSWAIQNKSILTKRLHYKISKHSNQIFFFRKKTVALHPQNFEIDATGHSHSTHACVFSCMNVFVCACVGACALDRTVCENTYRGHGVGNNRLIMERTQGCLEDIGEILVNIIYCYKTVSSASIRHVSRRRSTLRVIMPTNTCVFACMHVCVIPKHSSSMHTEFLAYRCDIIFGVSVPCMCEGGCVGMHC